MYDKLTGDGTIHYYISLLGYDKTVTIYLRFIHILYMYAHTINKIKKYFDKLNKGNFGNYHTSLTNRKKTIQYTR